MKLIFVYLNPSFSNFQKQFYWGLCIISIYVYFKKYFRRIIFHIEIVSNFKTISIPGFNSIFMVFFFPQVSLDTKLSKQPLDTK